MPAKNSYHKCGLCTKKYLSAQSLENHLLKEHTGVAAPASLMELIEKHQSASEVMRAAADWLEQSTGRDGALTPEAAEQVRREDARIQLILRLIAAKKIDRAFTVDHTFHDMFTLIRRKLQGEWKEKASPSEIMGLVERMQSLQHEELLFLKEIALLGEVNLGGLLEQLVRAVSGTSAKRLGMGKGGGTMAATGSIPARPDQRERLRRTARLVLMEIEAGAPVDEADVIDADVVPGSE